MVCLLDVLTSFLVLPRDRRGYNDFAYWWISSNHSFRLCADTFEIARYTSNLRQCNELYHFSLHRLTHTSLPRMRRYCPSDEFDRDRCNPFVIASMMHRQHRKYVSDSIHCCWVHWHPPTENTLSMQWPHLRDEYRTLSKCDREHTHSLLHYTYRRYQRNWCRVQVQAWWMALMPHNPTPTHAKMDIHKSYNLKQFDSHVDHSHRDVHMACQPWHSIEQWLK